jgi:hypothetical protein
MKKLLLGTIIGMAGVFAQQFAGADVTNTQAVLRFTGVNSAGDCRLSVAKNGAAQIHDTNPALYENAQSGLRPGNVLSGTTLYFVLGKRTYETALDGKSYSRALEAATEYSFELSGCGDTVTGTFSTASIPFGSTRGEPLPVASPGVYAYPTINWSDQNELIVDAQSGVSYRRMTGPGGGAPQSNKTFLAGTGSEWTNANSVISDDNNYATISGSQAPLYAEWNHAVNSLGTSSIAAGQALDYFQVVVKGKGSAGTQEDRNIEVCLSVDQGRTCATPWNVVRLSTSDATHTAGTKTPIDTLGSNPPVDRLRMIARYGNVVYNATTKKLTLSGKDSVAKPGYHDPFNLVWAPGTTITIAEPTLVIDDITTGANPTVTTQTTHGYATGDPITITVPSSDGLAGANGTWTVTVLSPTTFTLNGATTTGSYGTYFNNCVESGTPGSPPVIYVRNSNWPSPSRAKLSGFTDAGWTSLNGNTYNVTAHNGSTENWEIIGATTTGAYTQPGCVPRAKKLGGKSQKVGSYPIASVDNPSEITLASGPSSDIVADANGVGQDYEYRPFGVMIRKTTASSDTVSVQYVAANYAISGGMPWPAGGGPVTHRKPVNGFYMGIIGNAIYAFATDGSDVRLIGTLQQGLNTLAGDGCAKGGMVAHDDPNLFMCDTNEQGLHRTIAKGVLLNDGTALKDLGLAYPYAYPNIPPCNKTPGGNTPPCWQSWTNLFPTTPFDVVVKEADAAYIDKYYPADFQCRSTGIGWVEATQSRHMAVECGFASQNGAGTYYVFDLGNEIPYGEPGSTIRIIARRNTWEGKDCRWGGNHGGGLKAFPEKGYIGFLAHPLNFSSGTPTAPMAEDYRGGFGPYKTTVDTPFTATPGSCAGFAGNPFLPDVIPPGTGCDTRIVQGEPCDDSINSSPGYNSGNEIARYNRDTTLHNNKCGRTNAHYLTDAIPGDLFIFSDWKTTHVLDHEVMQLIDKGADGKTWTFYRGHLYGFFADNYYAPGTWAHPGLTIYAWRNADDHTYSAKGGIIAWDYMADPYPDDTHDAIIRTRNMTDGHGWEGWLAEGRTGASSPICGSACLGVRTGPIEQRWNTPTWDAVVTMSGKFAGQSTFGIPNNVDSHPTHAQSADGADTSWWIDGRPMLSAGSPAATSVTGQRYRYANSSLKIKYFDIMAFAGNNPILDVSGPGSSLGTTAEDSYKGCYALIAGECDPASQAGDYYVNAPAITSSAAQYYCCGTDPSQARDIGFMNAWAQAHQMSQTLIKDDAVGEYTRNLGRGFLQYRVFDTFYNLTETSDGRTALLRVMGLGGIRADAVSFKIPPIVLDSTNRGTFIPISVEGERQAGARTRVKFGYDPAFLCTSRQEPCYAVNTDVDESAPFLFASELSANSGISSAHYRLAIPGFSGTVLYYQVETVDGSGSIVSAGPVVVTTIL